MAIRFQCEACGKRYRVDDSKAGKTSKCKICGNPIVVPGSPLSDELTEAGQPIFRHGAREREFQLAIGDEDSIERISAHIEEHIGPVAGVFHELISDLVHIDVHMVAPTDERPYHTLFTSGTATTGWRRDPASERPGHQPAVRLGVCRRLRAASSGAHGTQSLRLLSGFAAGLEGRRLG